MQMTSFFACMAKSMDVEDKCAAERRALTNCATAAVRHWLGTAGKWDSQGGEAHKRTTVHDFGSAGHCCVAAAAVPTSQLPLLFDLQMRKGKQTNTINYHLQRLGRMIRR